LVPSSIPSSRGTSRPSSRPSSPSISIRDVRGRSDSDSIAVPSVISEASRRRERLGGRSFGLSTTNGDISYADVLHIVQSSTNGRTNTWRPAAQGSPRKQHRDSCGSVYEDAAGSISTLARSTPRSSHRLAGRPSCAASQRPGGDGACGVGCGAAVASYQCGDACGAGTRSSPREPPSSARSSRTDLQTALCELRSGRRRTSSDAVGGPPRARRSSPGKPAAWHTPGAFPSKHGAWHAPGQCQSKSTAWSPRRQSIQVHALLSSPLAERKPAPRGSRCSHQAPARLTGVRAASPPDRAPPRSVRPAW
jgi:hypothetical protein